MPSSLAGRLLILMVALLGAALLASTYAALRAANATVSVLVEEELEVFERVTRFSFARQSDALRERVELLTEDFGFKQAVATGERGTVLSALANHGERLQADIALLFSPDGEMILSSVALDEPTEAMQQQLSDMTASARTLLDTIGDETYRLVLSPVLAPDLIGWLVLGEMLDQETLSDLKQLTSAEVTLVAPADGGAVAGTVSTLELARTADSGSISSLLALLRESGWLSRHFTLDAQGAPVEIILSSNLNRALANYDPLRLQLVVIGVVALILAALLSLVASRWITRPVRAMVRSAQRISEGNYAAEIEGGGGSELDHLAEALSFMQSTVAEREARIQHQAQHDLLTQLPNRNYLTTLYQQYLRTAPTQPTFGIALLELENLPQLRDLYGGEFSDETLRASSWRVSNNLRRGDMAARVGDQQILIFFQDVSADHLDILLEKIREHRDEPLLVDDIPVRPEVRIGFAFSPAHGTDLDDLQRRAQLALSAAREQGEEYRVYRLGQDESHLRQIRIAGRLQSAVEREDFHLLYQPKFSISEGRICSAEALLRWEDEELGPVYPDEFIPIAEQTGAITALSEWVIQEATRNLEAWRAKGRDIAVSVNLSGMDVLQSQFIDRIPELVRAASLPMGSLVLEVTETAMMSDLDAARANLDRLNTLGMRISIDDYGTGFSSLSQLRSLPVKELKLDRSLVQDIDTQEGDRLIVSSTIEMAHHLGLEVVAEGVETKQILRVLAELNCDTIQGYLLSRPVSAEQFVAMLDQPEDNVRPLQDVLCAPVPGKVVGKDEAA